MGFRSHSYVGSFRLVVGLTGRRRRSIHSVSAGYLERVLHVLAEAAHYDDTLPWDDEVKRLLTVENFDYQPGYLTRGIGVVRRESFVCCVLSGRAGVWPRGGDLA